MRGRWQDWANALFGIWLVLSPVVLGDTTPVAATNGYIVGAAVLLLSILAIVRGQPWEEWLNLGLGIWLLIAPFVLNYAGLPVPMWNHLLVGLLIGGDALWTLQRRPPPEAV